MDRIGREVKRELRRFGPSSGLAELVAAWPAAAGATIAGNAWPARIARDGTLHVAASSAVWAFELAQLEPQLVSRLREALGEEAPSKLRFAVGRLPELAPGSDLRSEREVPHPSSGELEEACRVAAPISDDRLRALVARAAAASLARASADREF